MNLTQLSLEVFGEASPKQSYKMQGHSFSRTASGKPYCTNCGLMALNNDFSRWSVKHGCNSDLHPSFKAQRRKAIKF